MPADSGDSAAPGLRERKKQRTRATLIDAAMELCEREESLLSAGGHVMVVGRKQTASVRPQGQGGREERSTAG